MPTIPGKEKPKKHNRRLPGQRSAGSGDKTFTGASAPRVGGTSFSAPGVHKVSGTSSNKLIKQSIRNIKKTAASPQAKRAAVASYKKRK